MQNKAHRRRFIALCVNKTLGKGFLDLLAIVKENTHFQLNELPVQVYNKENVLRGTEMKKTITIVLASITLLIALSSCDDSQQTTVLTLSTIQGVNYFTTQGDLYFADLVEKETDGRVRIEVIAGGELYDNEAEAYQAIKNGDLDFTHVTPSTMAADEESLNVFLMPYLFDLPTGEGDKEFDQFETVIFEEIGRDLLSKIDGITGVEGLAFYDTGFRNFFSKEEITSAGWFSGKRHQDDGQ